MKTDNSSCSVDLLLEAFVLGALIAIGLVFVDIEVKVTVDRQCEQQIVAQEGEK